MPSGYAMYLREVAPEHSPNVLFGFSGLSEDHGSTICGCLATFPFLFLKVLPIGALSTSIGSAASSECVLVFSGRLAEGLGCGLSGLRQVTSIFGIYTRTSLPIDFDINKAGRMWVSCCELLVSHDPHGIARCGRLRLLVCGNRNSHFRFLLKLGKSRNPNFPGGPGFSSRANDK
ncbi:hypothetical protein F2Q69_00005732 [Brassica cretica]|uniref:Uncharacterized protein n=1 Tax=Brassica cretica TaxID=69181 RepID=A0A8S9NT92_BRACR|nr:hypothetical protein F2Q69_00005732 [Brassica cretica]